MRRRLLALAAALAVPMAPAEGSLVLCIGEHGHWKIEAAEAGCCAESDCCVDGGATSRDGGGAGASCEGCGDCADVPLSGLGVARLASERRSHPASGEPCTVLCARASGVVPAIHRPLFLEARALDTAPQAHVPPPLRC